MFIPPILAVCASFFIESPVSGRVLRYGGAYFFFVFLLGWTLNNYCGFNDFAFGTCGIFPGPIISIFSGLHLYSIGAYAILSPVLLVIAIVSEINVRRRE